MVVASNSEETDKSTFRNWGIKVADAVVLSLDAPEREGQSLAYKMLTNPKFSGMDPVRPVREISIWKRLAGGDDGKLPPSSGLSDRSSTVSPLCTHSTAGRSPLRPALERRSTRREGDVTQLSGSSHFRGVLLILKTCKLSQDERKRGRGPLTEVSPKSMLRILDHTL